MVESVSGANYGGYGNYGYQNKYNDDFLAQSYFNEYKNSAVQSEPTDSVSFTGGGAKTSEETTQDEKKSSGNTFLITTALIIGAFVTGKYFNKIKGLFTKSKAAQNAVNKANQTLNKAKTKATEVVNTTKKKIKGTSVTGAAEPITNAKEAQVMANIDTSHVNGKARRLVENAAENSVVTPAQQAKYDADIAYEPLKTQRKAAKTKLDAKNAKQRAEVNSLASNSKGGEKLEALAAQTSKAEKAAAKIADGGHLNPGNNNVYFTKNGAVTQIRTPIPDKNGNYLITDPKKIAKHLAKHNIDIASFAQPKSLNIAA